MHNNSAVHWDTQGMYLYWDNISSKTSLNFVDVHSDKNLTVHEISHMRRSSSIQSLNSDFVDAASDDSFQKEVRRLFIIYKEIIRTIINLDLYYNYNYKPL